MVCSRCGAELPDDVVVCTNCGYVVDKMRFDGISSYVSKGKGGVSIAARIFMIIGCIANFFSCYIMAAPLYRRLLLRLLTNVSALPFYSVRCRLPGQFL